MDWIVFLIMLVLAAIVGFIGFKNIKKVKAPEKISLGRRKLASGGDKRSWKVLLNGFRQPSPLNAACTPKTI